MIRALIAKDLRLVARHRVFGVVLVGYLILFLVGSLAFFSSFLGAGDSQFGAASELLFSRISGLQWLLLAGLAPWLILRMHGQELGESMVPSIASMIATPWQVLFSKTISSALYLIVLLSLSLPVLSLARLVGAAGLRRIAWSLADTFLFLTVLVFLVFHVRLRCRSWTASLAFSYVALAVLGFGSYELWSAVDHGSATLTLLLLGAFFWALLFLRGNRTLLYERN